MKIILSWNYSVKKPQSIGKDLWRERVKDKIRATKQLHKLQDKITYMNSQAKFLKDIDEFGSTADFLG